MRKIKLKNKKIIINNKKKEEEEEEEEMMLTSTSGFLVTKILSNRYWAKSPRS